MKLAVFLIAPILLALCGCSSTPVSVNTGTIRARTFNFVNRRGKPDPSFADKHVRLHSMLQSAIEGNLGARGVQKVATSGDITVAYLVIVGNNVMTSAISEYYGYNGDVMDLHTKAHEKYTRSGNPNYFEAGTLVIDIVDGKTFKLLKRGHTTRPLQGRLSHDARAAQIQEAVNEVLRDVRIEP